MCFKTIMFLALAFAILGWAIRSPEPNCDERLEAEPFFPPEPGLKGLIEEIRRAIIYASLR